MRRTPCPMGRPSRIWHQLVDDEFRLPADAIDDVIDADGDRNVVNEIDEPCDAHRRERHRPNDGHHRGEGRRQRPGCGKRGDAVGERAEEYPQRPLGDVVPDETDEDFAARTASRPASASSAGSRTRSRRPSWSRWRCWSGWPAPPEGPPARETAPRGRTSVWRGTVPRKRTGRAPAVPSARTMSNGRMRNPPRNA